MACHDQENVGLIECFKNRLRRLITVEPLVDLLYLLRDEDKELIRVRLTTEGNLGAVDHLLETITKVPRPLGWFREFIDALETVGCSQAAKYIINSPPSPAAEAENDSCVRLINLLHLSLVKMKTRDVCDSCCSLDILTEEDRENIFAEIERHGNISGARLLLRRLVRNEAGWFSTFLKALQMTGHPYLVKELMGEDLVEEEVDLYTDPSEQEEEASGDEGKDSCTSGRPALSPVQADGTQGGPSPPSEFYAYTPVVKKTWARLSLSSLLTQLNVPFWQLMTRTTDKRPSGDQSNNADNDDQVVFFQRLRDRNMQAVFWMTVGLLCLAPSCLLAQKPQPCKTPPLYTGAMTVGTQNEQLWAVGRYAYDAINQRIHLGETGKFNNTNFTYDALMLFQESILYEIHRHNQTCVKKALQADFHPMEVPKGAAFVSQVVLGSSSSPAQGLLVNNWWGDMPDKTGNYLVSFTEFGCFPISAFFKSKNMGWVSVSYFNNVVGVDPEVFVPPPYCKDAKLQENEEGREVTFFSLFNRD
ncbi:hypothetical protein ACEWY4_024879 [Coilia grayii]|uniref:Caspase recruitment domain-containing protein n=1 Tax=Coilia grayii TaxID=363190 RepID=A0ABD1IY13_9TELE